MSQPIKVAIVDDHQTIIDGYVARLNPEPDIQVVAASRYGDKLPAILAEYRPDVLILDVNVPTSALNDHPYPILHEIRRAHETYPHMAILVISMHAGRALVRAAIAAGAGGYLLKEDYRNLANLASIVRAGAGGSICLSRKAQEYLTQSPEERELLTLRQQEVLSILAANPAMTSLELAQQLGITDSTVRNILSATYSRLKVSNRTEAILKARQLGLITPDLPDLPDLPGMEASEPA